MPKTTKKSFFKIGKIYFKTIDERKLLWYNDSMVFKRAIAFDIGDKRIGVAVSDPFNEYAMPCETYFRTRRFDEDVAAIAKIAEARGADVIVCGMPVNFDGTESVQTEKTRRFVEALREKTSLPVELEDERFTTMQAREVQIVGGVKRDKRKQTIDSIAASYILEGYLSRMKKRAREESEENARKGLRGSYGYAAGGNKGQKRSSAPRLRDRPFG